MTAGEGVPSIAAQPTTGRERRYAIGLVCAMVVASLAALPYHLDAFPTARSFIPAFAAGTGFADLLSAALLFRLFGFDGSRAVLTAAAAYLFDALLIVPYALTFPGVVDANGFPGNEQSAVWLWVAWHCTFPALIAAAALDRSTSIRPARRRGSVMRTVAAALAVAAAAAYVVTAQRDALPVLVLHGRFSTLFTALAGFEAIATCVAVVVLLRAARPLSSLYLWLAVALIASAMDTALNGVSPARYSLAWYVGKSQTFLTASVVLLSLLAAWSGLHARLTTLTQRLSGALAEGRVLTESLERERRALMTQEEARSFRTIAQGIPEILWTARADGSRDWYNARWFEYTGQTPGDATQLGWDAANHPDDVVRVAERWAATLATGDAFEVDARIRRHDGAFRWFLTRALPLRDERGEIVRWCGTSVDVDDARKSRAREQMYARMTEELSAALSLDETLRAVTRLLVPEFGDYAIVNLLADGDEPRCVAVYHRDPARAGEIESLLGATYSRPMASMGTRLTISSGRQSLYEVVGDELWATIRPEYVATFRRLGVASVITVPLRDRGRTVGTLSAVMSDSERRFSANDVPLFGELARRISPAVANAEAYERERRVARSFQEAAMVHALPRIPGLRFDAIYEAAHAEATVGGDWYDAVRLPDGRVMLSIGDVAGSGLDAAVTMGSVRQSIRTAALINPDPAMILEAVDRIVRAIDDRFVTTFVALFDPATFELRYASAGHPPAALRAPDGTIVLLDGGDLPLGLRKREIFPSSGRFVEPGSLLVAYTDGLVEFDRDAVAGERALLAAALAADAASAAHDVYQAISGSRPARDDVAVLTVAFDALLTVADGGAHARHWSFDSRDAAAAGKARSEYAQLLRDAGVLENDVFAGELVFGELIGNAYRYAPGDVDVILDLSASAPVLHVLDTGDGFEYRPRLPSDMLAERGRGLFLVRAYAEEVSAELRLPRGSHVRVVLAARPRVRALSTLARDDLV